MKISKLFHWLYAILMLLPCFAILVKCAYVAFNKNAFESYYGETINQEEAVYTDELLIGNKYYLQINMGQHLPTTNYIKVGELNMITSRDDMQSFYESYKPNITYIRFTYDSSNNSERLSFYNDTYTLLNYYGYSNYNTNIDFIAENKIYLSFDNFFYYINYKNFTYLDNVFYYAVDEVCNNDLFAWASNSFLNAPLTYITDLFNMPNDNAVILLMSYWFNISIIWLCFDVMIYVPLLVHRWLDKGIVE